jgi:phosphatidylinositol alpha-1,6-mannosyltransferase
MPEKIICITNDFGPRAGGIETFVMGLIERLPVGSVTVYTSQQGDTRAYDQNWLDKFGVRVIRDKSKVLLPTPRVFRAVRRVIVSEKIESIFFGAAAIAYLLRKRGNRALSLLITTLGPFGRVGYKWVSLHRNSFVVKAVHRLLNQSNSRYKKN